MTCNAVLGTENVKRWGIAAAGLLTLQSASVENEPYWAERWRDFAGAALAGALPIASVA